MSFSYENDLLNTGTDMEQILAEYCWFKLSSYAEYLLFSYEILTSLNKYMYLILIKFLSWNNKFLI